MVEFCGEIEDFVRRVDMGKAARTVVVSSRRVNLSSPDIPGTTVLDIVYTSSVDEENDFKVLHGVRQLRGELVKSNNLDFGVAKFRFHSICGAPRDSVITAKGIPVRKDEDSRHGSEAELYARATSSTTSPSGFISWIRSGICPHACVEQLRQGS